MTKVTSQSVGGNLPVRFAAHPGRRQKHIATDIASVVNPRLRLDVFAVGVFDFTDFADGIRQLDNIRVSNGMADDGSSL